MSPVDEAWTILASEQALNGFIVVVSTSRQAFNRILCRSILDSLPEVDQLLHISEVAVIMY